jgi:hypothetical protein
MRLAIVLDNIYLAEMKSPIKKIMLFEADGDLVVAIDEDLISLSDTNYLSLWLLAKRVACLYCDGLTEEGEVLLNKAGIKVYPLNKIRDHPILQALLLKEEKENS